MINTPQQTINFCFLIPLLKVITFKVLYLADIINFHFRSSNMCVTINYKDL